MKTLENTTFEKQDAPRGLISSIAHSAKMRIVALLSLLSVGSGCIDIDKATAKMKAEMAETLEEKLDEKMGDTAALLSQNCSSESQEGKKHLSVQLADRLLQARADQGLVVMSCDEVQDMVKNEIRELGIRFFNPRDLSFGLKDDRTVARLSRKEDEVSLAFDRVQEPSGAPLSVSYEEPDPLIGTSVVYSCTPTTP